MVDRASNDRDPQVKIIDMRGGAVQHSIVDIYSDVHKAFPGEAFSYSFDTAHPLWRLRPRSR